MREARVMGHVVVRTFPAVRRLTWETDSSSLQSAAVAAATKRQQYPHRRAVAVLVIVFVKRRYGDKRRDRQTDGYCDRLKPPFPLGGRLLITGKSVCLSSVCLPTNNWCQLWRQRAKVRFSPRDLIVPGFTGAETMAGSDSDGWILLILLIIF